MARRWDAKMGSYFCADPYVTDETFKLTQGLFRFEGLGKKAVKGRAEPVEVYRVLASSSRRTRFDVNVERGLTPLVGRQRELELLLDAWDRAKTGRGQAVSIVADAGVGKSRLLYEFRKATANEEVTVLEGKCLSYSRQVPYHPVLDILKSNFHLQDGERDEDIQTKVRRGLQALQADEATTLPFLLELLGVKDSGFDPRSLSPEGKKDRTIQAIARLVLKGAEIRPLILVVEDLHWMDESSEDVFKDLLEHIAGARVLLIFTYRPEYVHTWGQRSYHHHVHLNRLSGRESLAMVTHLLGTEHIDRNLADLIQEKTEGVPFFIEEFISSDPVSDCISSCQRTMLVEFDAPLTALGGSISIDPNVVSSESLENGIDSDTHNIVGGSISASPIPVPAAAWLFGSALSLFGWLRHRSECP